MTRRPIACTIRDDEVADRVALLEHLRASAGLVERTPSGLSLVFPVAPAIEADLHRFVTDESRCCAFWDFTVLPEGEGLRLRWDGPPEVAELLDGLLRWFRSEADLPDLRGLL